MNGHVVLGFCWLDIVAAAILLGVIIYAAVKLNKLKKQKNYLEDLLSGEPETEE